MFRFASSVALVTLLFGCATGGSSRPSTRANEAPLAPQPAMEAPGADAASKWPGAREAEPASPSHARPSPGAAARGEAKAYDEAPREDRPGLGTEWGDTRTSHVTDAPFERRSPESPWATSTLYYNDANGIRAMTRGAVLSSNAVSAISVAGGALTVRLVDSWGSPLPAYDLGSRQYVTGRHGDRYVIQIQNHTGQRFEAVASVDGLDVIDGRAGSLAKRGYLIAPWGSLEIEGFRRSMHEVAEFRFGSVSDSYAARTGSDRNVGVIGVAFFDERGARNPWLERESERRHGADPFPGRFAAPPR
jgi:hypothetical protein